MKKALLFDFEVDKTKNEIQVKRQFNAPVDLVWSAWTEADLLDRWWAPKPWQNETQSMDFREGGHWLYAMKGPEGEKHYCRADYTLIESGKRFIAYDGFCDEQGTILPDFPRNYWENNFIAEGNQSSVHIILKFDSLADLEKIIAMGFQEGFTAGLENLDQYIEAQFYLRKQKKLSNKARVSVYLNFNGKTEAAFLFYKEVFKTEFIKGIQRFEDIPQSIEQPELHEKVKKMVLHVELPIVGDMVLMGTDAPTEMGFTVKQGNNMHINLEPDNLEEARRLFTALSAEGEIEMPLQEMFWGGYYAGFTDRFGINWMINYQPN